MQREAICTRTMGLFFKKTIPCPFPNLDLSSPTVANKSFFPRANKSSFVDLNRDHRNLGLKLVSFCYAPNQDQTALYMQFT